MRTLRAAERTPAPWKNGGGVTREVAIWPEGSALDAFDWRVSIAEVAASGPFSTFPGVDRVLTVIDGAALRLEVDGMASVEMDEGSPPFAFPGEAACSARLAAGPIRDLNVMTARSAYAARVRRAAGPLMVDCTAQTTLVLELETEDAVIAGRGESLSFEAGRLIVVEIEPAD